MHRDFQTEGDLKEYLTRYKDLLDPVTGIIISEKVMPRIKKQFGKLDAQKFLLHSNDGVLFCNGDTSHVVDYLLRDSVEGSVAPEEIFVYELPHNLSHFMEKLCSLHKKHTPIVLESYDPLTPEVLSQIQSKLKAADLSSFIRLQTIYQSTNEELVIWGRECHVSIQALQNYVFPAHNMPTSAWTGSTWLFRHLTMLLDQRVLAQIKDFLGQKKEERLHLNLNIRTMFTPTFQKAMESIQQNGQTVILELDILDVLAHPDAFKYAQERSRDLPVKILLDGIKGSIFKYLNFADFATHGIKLIWDGHLSELSQYEIQEIWDNFNADQVILGHCDSERALTWAKSVGIEQFQGNVFKKK